MPAVARAGQFASNLVSMRAEAVGDADERELRRRRPSPRSSRSCPGSSETSMPFTVGPTPHTVASCSAIEIVGRRLRQQHSPRRTRHEECACPHVRAQLQQVTRPCTKSATFARTYMSATCKRSWSVLVVVSNLVDRAVHRRGAARSDGSRSSGARPAARRARLAVVRRLARRRRHDARRCSCAVPGRAPTRVGPRPARRRSPRAACARPPRAAATTRRRAAAGSPAGTG